MTDAVLYFMHHGLNLLMGVVLSAAFCGIPFSRKNVGVLCAIVLLCGSTMLLTLFLFGEQLVWELYPLIVHALLGVLLCLFFRKWVITVVSAVSLAYLCCQPTKWFGLITEIFTANAAVVWCVKIAVSLTVFLVALLYVSGFIAKLFRKGNRNSSILGLIPFAYYLFNYIASIYTNLWEQYSILVSEFLSFSLCIIFMSFSIIYYREYERKLHAQERNQIVEITVQQQAKELESIRKSNLETVLLRHDMRHLLSSVALSIKQNDKAHALSLISGYIAHIEAASLHRHCANDTLNYVFMNYESKCHAAGIAFEHDISLEVLRVDEVCFASIISNALDNAVYVQAALPEGNRQIKLLLKESNGKLLLSVKNPFKEKPRFVDGLPVATRDGHGYGTQSILYLTEKLGGKCQFSIEDDLFVLRVIL